MWVENLRKGIAVPRKTEKQAPSPLAERIYAYVRAVPRGRVVTYGQIAEALGDPHLARAVGTLLHRNPDGEGTPCYRVVNAAGRLSRAYAFGGLEGQKARLEADGVEVRDGRVDLGRYRYRGTETP